MGVGGGDNAVVATARDATLTVAAGAVSSRGVMVSRVVAPVDGWVVVRSALSPGAVLGATWVPRGSSSDVLIRLTAAESELALLSLHVDRGKRKTLEYDPENAARSFDSQVNAGRDPVQLPLVLDRLGIEVEANSVLIQVEDQSLRERTLVVPYLITTAPSWISVNEVENGLPGIRIGLVSVGAGESQQIRVPLSETPVSDQVVVTVHADRGGPGLFDYSDADPLGSTDRPYSSAGVIVSKRITPE